MQIAHSNGGDSGGGGSGSEWHINDNVVKVTIIFGEGGHERYLVGFCKASTTVFFKNKLFRLIHFVFNPPRANPVIICLRSRDTNSTPHLLYSRTVIVQSLFWRRSFDHDQTSACRTCSERGDLLGDDARSSF